MTNIIYGSGMHPVDKIAGRVVSAGTHFKPAAKPDQREQSTPIPIRHFHLINPTLRHLVGVTFGRFAVRGLSESCDQWVVRCVCGTYALRSLQAIVDMKNTQDACSACRHLLMLKKHEHFRRTGKHIEMDALPGAAPPRKAIPPPLPLPPAEKRAIRRQLKLAAARAAADEEAKKREARRAPTALGLALLEAKTQSAHR